MKNVLSFLLLAALPLGAFGQKTTFLSDISGMFGRNVEQISSLADAIPGDKYDWRPADGVRSVGESMLHIASVNYLLGQTLGLPAPAGINPMELESSVSGKDDVLKTVKASFDFAAKAMGQLKKKNLKEMVELPFGKFSKRQVTLIIYEHSGEHKGQLIAYARSNGIAPPWSN